MVDSTKDEPKRSPGVSGGGVAVADDGDVAFGGMAGAGILAAILVAFFVSAGIIGYTPEPLAVTSSPTTEHGGDETADSLDADGFQISADLSAGGFPPVQLSASGNTVTVRGPVVDETTRDSILSFVGDQPNVETVVDEMFIPEPEPALSSANVAMSDDGIILEGTVPNEVMAAQLRAAAAANFSSDQITDELTVLDGATGFALTTSGSITDPLLYSDLTAAIQAAVDGVGLTGDYTDEVVLDAQVDASLNELVRLEPILFQTGTAVIDRASIPTIDQAAEILKAFPGATVEIGGHTDSTGDPSFNRILSQARAESVLAALRERGVQSDLTAVGYGPDSPVGDNATAEGRQQNRRIEFKAL
jgi:outer membrane protein OmpA-like peptidoglycan-associated protein